MPGVTPIGGFVKGRGCGTWMDNIFLEFLVSKYLIIFSTLLLVDGGFDVYTATFVNYPEKTDNEVHENLPYNRVLC
jgi:hypothetical protein